MTLERDKVFFLTLKDGRVLMVYNPDPGNMDNARFKKLQEGFEAMRQHLGPDNFCYMITTDKVWVGEPGQAPEWAEALFAGPAPRRFRLENVDNATA